MNRKLHLFCAAIAAAPLAWPTAAVFAQSVQEFRLEPGAPMAAPRPQGPVDEDIPIRPPAPPSSEPQPTAQTPATPPTITLPAARPTASAMPQPRAEAPANRPTAAAPQAAPAQTTTAPGASTPRPTLPEPVTPAPAMDAAAPPLTSAAPPVADEVATKSGATESTIPFWPWLAGAAAALLAAAAWFLLSRKQAQPPARAELAPRPRPRPAPVSALAPAARAEPEPAAPSPSPAPPTAGLNLELMPKSLSASLFMATLHYRIAVENAGIESLGPITISGDMIAAHASASPAEQLVAIGKDLPEIHRIAGLRPGERTELTGEIRLPLSAITPIRKGQAMLFVPLVRIYALDPAADTVIGGGTFVVGEPPQTPGGRIRPFRLDLGPRVYPTVEQRKLAMPDAMPLDGQALAG